VTAETKVQRESVVHKVRSALRVILGFRAHRDRLDHRAKRAIEEKQGQEDCRVYQAPQALQDLKVSREFKGRLARKAYLGLLALKATLAPLIITR
jgi:hypothetical protein